MKGFDEWVRLSARKDELKRVGNGKWRLVESMSPREVIEDEQLGVVTIGDHQVDGFIDDVRCVKCDRPRVYYDRYDAYFCAECNLWLEGACTDHSCDYCRDRPARPLGEKE
jgi:hypothetical protein